jgi:heme/copper-type cytochrome/quinol oxidase subunit 2
MKTTALFLLVAALLTGSFGYWGMYTKAGRIQYDEMAGMIPWFAQLAAIFFFVVAASLLAVMFFRSRKKSAR